MIYQFFVSSQSTSATSRTEFPEERMKAHTYDTVLLGLVLVGFVKRVLEYLDEIRLAPESVFLPLTPGV